MDHVSEAALAQNILKDMGVFLPFKAKILDFGCGSGTAVYAYLDRGYENIYGYDIQNYVSLQTPQDAYRFFFSAEELDANRGSFDFIFSNQVLEHVMDYPKVLGQIYDLLKPGGVSLHFSPQNGV